MWKLKTTTAPDGEKVELRLPPEQVTRWRASASVAGLTLTEWIREICEAQAMSPDDVQLIRDRLPDRAKLG